MFCFDNIVYIGGGGAINKQTLPQVDPSLVNAEMKKSQGSIFGGKNVI